MAETTYQGRAKNKLTAQVAFDGGVSIETLSAGKTLTNKSANFQKLDGGTSDRDITLPAGTAEFAGTVFWIFNVGTTNKLSVKTAAGALVLDVPQGTSAKFGMSGEGTWAALDPVAPIVGFNALSRRYELKWVAGQRGKPALNAVIALDENSNAAAHLASNIADPDFEVLGTNMTTALVTYNVEGGITLTTAGADGDEAILLPHLDTNQTAWQVVTWGTDQQTAWECHIKSGANITNAIIWAGLKLTNTEVLSTDAKAAWFRYEDDVTSGKWIAVTSINNVDVSTDTGITVAVSTSYRLRIAIDSSRLARFYINDALVYTSTALDDTTDFIPYIGVAADGAAGAKALTVYGQAISRTMA